MQKNRRVILLLGIIIALLSFYVGLESWISSNEKPQPPPVVVAPVKTQQSQPQQESIQKQTEEQKGNLNTQESKQDAIAKVIQDSKVQEKPQEIQQKTLSQESKQGNNLKQESGKVYTIQIGAFTNKENALKALNKAKSLGYSAYLKEEEDFYKVMIKVRTSDINTELRKLRVTFGGAFLR